MKSLLQQIMLMLRQLSMSTMLHMKMAKLMQRLQINSLQHLKLVDAIRLRKFLKKKNSFQRSHSGYSVVTDGLMISVTADLIMFLQQTRMSMYSYSIQKFILTQADRLLSLLTLVQSLSSQQQVRMLRRKTLQQLL